MKQYRFVHKSDGWHTQIRRFGLWWRVWNVGPFGYSDANLSLEWSKDCLIANVINAGLRMVPALREQRRVAKENIRSPVTFRVLPSNAKDHRADQEARHGK